LRTQSWNLKNEMNHVKNRSYGMHNSLWATYNGKNL